MTREYTMTYDCTTCRHAWITTAKLIRDDECPRCGFVSQPRAYSLASDLPAFDPRKVTITRKRFSQTQHEVLLEYDGRRIEQYGDKLELIDGEWTGICDAEWIDVAKREAIKRGLAAGA